MSIKFNGNTVYKVKKDGVWLQSLKFQNTEVLEKSNLIISGTSQNKLWTPISSLSGYNFYIYADTLTRVTENYPNDTSGGYYKTKTCSIVKSDRVTIDVSSFVNAAVSHGTSLGSNCFDVMVGNPSTGSFPSITTYKCTNANNKKISFNIYGTVYIGGNLISDSDEYYVDLYLMTDSASNIQNPAWTS